MSDYEERYAREAAPRVAFTGMAGDFFLLQLGNLALTILTLGIYRFWGKAKYRRYLWSHTILDGDPLEYRGTGLELFIGAILVILLISIPFGILSFVMSALFNDPQTGILITQILFFLVISYLIGVGQYRSWRYMFSRTAWRGIRSGMTEQGFSFGLYSFGMQMLQLITLGLATPWVSVKIWNRLTRDVRIGNLALTSDADHRPLWSKYLLVWALVTVPMIAFSVWFYFRFKELEPSLNSPGPADPTELLLLIGGFYLGLIVIGLLGAALFAQYWAAYLKETIEKTRIGDTMRLRIEVETWDVIRFYLGNIALSMTGIGQILLPYRNWGFMARRVWIDGEYDPRDLEQSALVGPGQGDGIADAFDVSGF
jgi:uncharacterized membrane protein YjgN (DUF898 family)